MRNKNRYLINAACATSMALASSSALAVPIVMNFDSLTQTSPGISLYRGYNENGVRLHRGSAINNYTTSYRSLDFYPGWENYDMDPVGHAISTYTSSIGIIHIGTADGSSFDFLSIDLGAGFNGEWAGSPPTNFTLYFSYANPSQGLEVNDWCEQRADYDTNYQSECIGYDTVQVDGNKNAQTFYFERHNLKDVWILPERQFFQFDNIRLDNRIQAAVAPSNSVPEPGTLFLLGAGLLGVIVRSRRNSYL